MGAKDRLLLLYNYTTNRENTAFALPRQPEWQVDKVWAEGAVLLFPIPIKERRDGEELMPREDMANRPRRW